MADNKDASAALGDVVSGMDTFLKAANNHEVWIGGQGVQVDVHLIEGVLQRISDAKDEIDSLLVAEDTTVSTGPVSFLGANPVGEGMSQKFARRSNGDQYSMFAVLKTYRDQLDKAEQAVRMSLRDYQSADQDGAHRLRPSS